MAPTHLAGLVRTLVAAGLVVGCQATPAPPTQPALATVAAATPTSPTGTATTSVAPTLASVAPTPPGSPASPSSTATASATLGPTPTAGLATASPATSPTTPAYSVERVLAAFAAIQDVPVPGLKRFKHESGSCDSDLLCLVSFPSDLNDLVFQGVGGSWQVSVSTEEFASSTVAHEDQAKSLSDRASNGRKSQAIEFALAGADEARLLRVFEVDGTCSLQMLGITGATGLFVEMSPLYADKRCTSAKPPVAYVEKVSALLLAAVLAP